LQDFFFSVGFINANQLFGAKDMFNQRPYSVDVSAQTVVSCIAIGIHEFHCLISPIMTDYSIIAQNYNDFTNATI
jgi:hypothetical protein